MSQEVQLKPGQGLSLKCPQGSKHNFKESLFFPSHSKEIWLVPKSGSEVFLSPMKYGSWNFSIPCEPEGSIEAHFSLQPVEGQKVSEIEAPFSLVNPTIPFSFFLFWALIAALFISVLFYIYKKYLQPKFSVAGENESDVFEITKPDREWHNLLAEIKSLKTQKHSVSNQTLKTALNDSGPKLRNFLEFRLHFAAAWASTPEFIGALKAATIGQPLSENFYQTLERLLYTLDTIRFAKKEVTVFELEPLEGDFIKLTEEVEKVHPTQTGEAV